MGQRGQREMLAQRKGCPALSGPEEGSDGHPAQDDGRSRMQEDTPEEKRDTMMTELAERVISLEKENRELKKAIHEMEAKAAGQVQAIRATAERCSMLEKGVLEIVHTSGSTRPSTEASHLDRWAGKAGPNPSGQLPARGVDLPKPRTTH